MDRIQPSSDAKATALIVAQDICTYYKPSINDKTGFENHTEESLKKKAKLIAEIATMLKDAVNG